MLSPVVNRLIADPVLLRNLRNWPLVCLTQDRDCVFRTNVTGRFGMVTGDFGNVTGDFGNVDRADLKSGLAFAHDINHAGYARRLLPERACPRTG